MDRKKPRKRPVPFCKASTAAQVFQLAIKGTTVDEICKFVRERGGNPHILLRTLRRSHIYGYEWRVEEADGRFQIVYPVE